MKAPVSATMITAGEASLERAVASIRDHVAQVVIVYTGTDDLTAARVRGLADAFAWYTDANEDGVLMDFAAARNRSLALATEKAITWLDSDDTVIGAENLPRMVEALGTDQRILANYAYWHDPDTGACTLMQHRERLVLNDGNWIWRNCVHEGLVHVRGQSVEIHNGWVTWKHHRNDDGKKSHERNLKILQRYVAKNGADTWAHYQLGHALADLGEPEQAVEHFKAYLEESGRDDERALACMRLAQLLGSAGSLGNAFHWIEEALKCEPEFFDAMVAKARLQLVRGITTENNRKDILESIVWCQRALLAPTTTILPTNPQDRALAYETMFHAYEHLEDEPKAVEAIRSALAIEPSNPRLRLRALRNPKPSAGCLDIVFACGPTPEPWNPGRSSTLGIGGSETAVIEMSRRLAAMGHRVRVFTSCGAEGLYDGVEYRESLLMTEIGEVDVLIAWRNAGYLEEVPAKVKLLWVHDLIVMRASPYRFTCADKVLALSKWHKEWLLGQYGEMGLREEQVELTRNGIEPARFGAPGEPPTTRNSRCAIYSSSADRGLEILLELWPRIRAGVPDAELHIFYGRVGWLPEAFAERIEEAIEAAAPLGVVDHGRVNQAELAKAMLGAGAWLYPSVRTLTVRERWLETFCIGVCEAAAAGLHVVTADWGALTETARGVRLGGDFESAEWKDEFVRQSVRALLRTDDEVRAKISAAARKKHDWRGVADEWHELLTGMVGG